MTGAVAGTAVSEVHKPIANSSRQEGKFLFPSSTHKSKVYECCVLTQLPRNFTGEPSGK